VAGGWRRLHAEGLHNFSALPNVTGVIISRRMRRAEHIARMGEMRNVHKILVGNPERKRPLGRPMSRWEDNIRKDIREVGWEGVHWIHLAQDRDQRRAVVKTVMNLRLYERRKISCVAE
jgi:hypothetical protein